MQFMKDGKSIRLRLRNFIIAHLSVCLSILLSVCLFHRLCVCVCLSVSVCLFVCLSVCLLLCVCYRSMSLKVRRSSFSLLFPLSPSVPIPTPVPATVISGTSCRLLLPPPIVLLTLFLGSGCTFQSRTLRNKESKSRC